MKNLKNIVFLSNKKISLVVLSTFNGVNNILFADEVKANNGDIQGKLSNLLTNAANFLGSNIKSVDLVFEDFNIGVSLINKTFNNCSSKEEAIKQIYKDAKVQNKFVNNLVFSSVRVENNKVRTICKSLVSDYSVYQNYKDIVKHCNLKIENCVNIATLLNENSEELILSIANNNAYACFYVDNTLSNCVNLNVNFDLIINKISDKFNCSRDSVIQQVNIAKVVLKNNNYEYDLSWNYDLKSRSLTTVKASEFTQIWREELLNQIKQNVLINNWKNTKVLTSNEINNFNSTKVEHDIVGLDVLSDDVVLALANVDRLPKIESQSKYDAQVEKEFERVAA